MRQHLYLILICSSLAFPSYADEPLTIAVSRSPLSLPFFVAMQENYFAEEGVQVKFKEVIGGNRAMAAMLDKKADLATVSETVAMFGSFKSQGFAILSSFVKSNDDIKLVTLKGKGIEKIADLAGKRAGTVKGSASHYFLDTMLLLSDVDPSRVEVVGLAPEDMADALKTGRVDASAVWEPYPFKILASVKNAQIIPAPRVYTLSFNLVGSRKIINSKRKANLPKLLRALERAQKFIATQPKKAQAVLQSHLGLQQSFVDWIWPRYNYRLSLDQSLLSTLESEARWARKQGHVKAAKSPNYLDFIYSAALRHANPRAVSIVD